MAQRSNTKSTDNLAARAGRWSAQHRKKAIFGWLAFVIIAVFIGGSVGTRTLTDEEYGIGESGRADQAMSDHFPDKANESVLIQSQNGASNKSPEYRRRGRVGRNLARGHQERPQRPEPVRRGQRGHAVAGRQVRARHVRHPRQGDAAEDKVDTALNAVSKLDKQETGYRIEEFGDASASKALSKAFEDDFRKAEVTSLPITLIILILAFGALLAAFVPLLLAITAVAAAISLIGPISQIWPVDEAISSVVLLIGLAVGVDYSMFYLRREREERARGRSEEAALKRRPPRPDVPCSCPASP